MGFTQLHNIAQQSQTVRPFFQHVSHQDQNVIRGEGDLLQQVLEEGQIAVDVADSQNTTPRGKLRMDNDSIL